MEFQFSAQSFAAIIWDALLDLVAFVKFKELKKHPWKIVTLSKVAGFSNTLPWVVFTFLNCANGTKSHKHHIIVFFFALLFMFNFICFYVPMLKYRSQIDRLRKGPCNMTGNGSWTATFSNVFYKSFVVTTYLFPIQVKLMSVL